MGSQYSSYTGPYVTNRSGAVSVSICSSINLYLPFHEIAAKSAGKTIICSESDVGRSSLASHRGTRIGDVQNLLYNPPPFSSEV